MPRGKKICPSCSTECGVRTGVCECGHDFSSSPKKENGGEDKKKKKKNKKKDIEQMSSMTKDLIAHVALNPYVEQERLSPDEHAERILSYGSERAKSLLRQHRSGSTWSHVNWKKVEAGL